MHRSRVGFPPESFSTTISNGSTEPKRPPRGWRNHLNGSPRMTDREQIVEHEKRRSPLSDREIEEADDRSSTTAKVVHEAIRLEGTDELERPSSSVGWSGVAAGLTMG